MLRPTWAALAIAVSCLPATPALGQSLGGLFPPEIESEIARSAGRPRPAPTSDLVVVFWFRAKDPLGTLRYQTYDVRKGQYTTQVDDWLSLVMAQYPDYIAFRRPLDLKGRDPARAVEEAVRAERDELARALTQVAKDRLREARLRDARLLYERGYLGPTTWGARPGSSASRSRVAPLYPPGDSGYRSTPRYLFPNPFPYPRPHP
jgi:hypothetical protein